MVTRAGSLVAFAAIGLLGAGRIFGLVELYVVGAAIGALVLISTGWVFLARLDLGAGRSISPPRVHVGSPARATIRVRNLRRARTPVLRLLDPVTGTTGADLLVNPLRGGETATIAYRLPTDHRGLVEVGPLEVVVTDPFGLSSVRTRAAGTGDLTVFPRLDPIAPPAQAAGPDPMAGAVHPSALGRSGDEFYALRPYVVGDDLRRVHWASTARTGELVVRQDELPWQGRTTVLLDQRRAAAGVEVFEAAVSAAASVVHAAWRRGDLVRLATTGGTATQFGNGHAHLEAVFEELALVGPSNRADLATAARAIERSGSNGALVAVTGEVRASEHEALKRAAVGFGRVTLVTFDDRPVAGAVPGLGVIAVASPGGFAAAWDAAHVRPRVRGAS